MKAFLLAWLSCALLGDSLAELLRLGKPTPGSLLLGKPTFHSTNFVNILNWKTTGELPPGTVYDVEYKTYGDAWHKKSECQNISEPSCDLTWETEIIKERYHAQVRVRLPNGSFSEWVMSARFCPRDETNIGDLKVNYTPRTRAVKFVVQPPYTPFRDEENQLQTMEDIFSQYSSVQYEVIIIVNKTQRRLTYDEKEFEIPHLEPGTEYPGTIQMVFLDRKSKPYKFSVRTLSDNTWLFYLFGAAGFMIVLICATICYFIYKYIKLHAVRQPRSLDLKDMSHFQTLMLSTEHILTLHSPSKPPWIFPGEASGLTRLTEAFQINQGVSALPETSYRQQTKAASFQPLAHPQTQADDPLVGYAPQVVKNNPTYRLDHTPSSSTYGICVEGAGSVHNTGFPPNQGLRLESLVEAPVGDGQSRAQKPTQVERGWCEERTQVAPTLGPANAGQTQQQNMPQQLPYCLQEWVPITLDEGPGSYRKQAVELSPSTLETAQDAITEDQHLLPAMPQAFLEHFACNNGSQDHSLGPQHVPWDSFAWTDRQWQPSGIQTTGPLTPTSKGLTREIESRPVDSLDFAPDNGQFTGLLRDLELKVLWDHGPGANAEV